jgi:MerR HTH family regulatory protein
MSIEKKIALEIGEKIRRGEDPIVIPKLYTISEVAKELDRVPHTLRVWGYDNRLPERLRPRRNSRGWRVWTWGQIQELKQWIIDEDMRPGKGLRNGRKNEDEN